MLLCYFAQKLCIKTNVVDRKLHLEMCAVIVTGENPIWRKSPNSGKRAEDGHVCQNSNVSERN